eukprot:scaffold5185_cov110-Isochrysis_galbana.AAC.9
MAPTTASLRPLLLFIVSANALHGQGVSSSRSAVTMLRGGASASAIDDKAAEARERCAVARPRTVGAGDPSPSHTLHPGGCVTRTGERRPPTPCPLQFAHPDACRACRPLRPPLPGSRPGWQSLGRAAPAARRRTPNSRRRWG